MNQNDKEKKSFFARYPALIIVIILLINAALMTTLITTAVADGATNQDSAQEGLYQNQTDVNQGGINQNQTDVNQGGSQGETDKFDGSYNININATNVDGAITNPTKIYEGSSVNLVFTAKENYVLPKEVTVSGAASSWDKPNGTLTISNPTGAVSVTIDGKVAYSVTATTKNLSISGSADIIGEEDVLTITIALAKTDNKNDPQFSVPKGVTVNGATGTYTRTNDISATLVIENPTSDVTFDVTGLVNGHFTDDSGYSVNYNGYKKYFSYTTAKEDASAVKEMFTRASIARGIVLPQGITSIATNAFGSTSNLKKVLIPATVTAIGGGAFNSCSKLEKVVFESGVQSQLTQIGVNAFTSCESLTEIAIPASVTSIGKSAFQYCSNLKYIYFDDNSQLISIDEGAFLSCGLIGIAIPASITSIGGDAFKECTKMTFVIFLATSFSIGNGAFYKCEELTTINYAGTEQQWNSNVTKGISWNSGTPKSPKTLKYTYNYKG